MSTMLHEKFLHAELASALLPHAFDRRDGAHDEAHLLRVWRNAAKIIEVEGGDTEILVAATILHDCVWIDKASPERSKASRLAADKAGNVLTTLGWPDRRVETVRHAIEAHSFSAGITPVSIEAKILQDADRLDAIGWIGVARCFYVAGMRKTALYHVNDPGATDRELDDITYALDHFQTKLLRLGEGFNTTTGRTMAQQRLNDLRRYFDGILDEIR